MEKELSGMELERFNFKQFNTIVRKYVSIRELTPETANDLFKRIIVHTPDKSSGKRVQHKQIVFSSTGEAPLPETSEQEPAASA